MSKYSFPVNVEEFAGFKACKKPWFNIPGNLRQEKLCNCAAAVLKALSNCLGKPMTEEEVITIAKGRPPGITGRLLGVYLKDSDVLHFLQRQKIGYKLLEPNPGKINACLSDNKAIILIFEQYKTGYVRSPVQETRSFFHNRSYHTLIIVDTHTDGWVVFDPGWARGGWQFLHKETFGSILEEPGTILISVTPDGDGIKKIKRKEGTLNINPSTGRWIFSPPGSSGLPPGEEIYLRHYESTYSPIENTNVPYEFIVNVTSRCSLDCRYCYAFSPGKQHDMSINTFRKIWEFAYRLNGKDPFSMVLHGGEPLLVFRNLLEEIDSAINSGADVQFSMQTNGMGMDEKTVTEIVSRSIPVGVSLDGPEDLHNRYRGGHAHALECLHLLKASGCNPGILSTMTVESCQRIEEIIDYFVDIGIYQLAFSPMLPVGRGKSAKELAPGGKEIGEAWIKAWHRLLHYRQKGIPLDIRELNTFLLHLTSNLRPSLCGRTPCAAGRALLGIDTDGSVYSCDMLVGFKEHYIGNVEEISIESISNHLAASPLSSDLPGLVRPCRNCHWETVCMRGCPAANWLTGNIHKESCHCKAYQAVLEEMAVDLSIDTAAAKYVEDVVTKQLVDSHIIRKKKI
jgi:uncharacterized protein